MTRIFLIAGEASGDALGAALMRALFGRVLGAAATSVVAGGVTFFALGGLGLAIVRSLCAAMHLTLTLESVPGTGTTFRIGFPDPHGK
mgnify:CR=1 FL=1